ncbi:uncharacterized protein LY89DRAFT_327299 [Mollisia scopiformis]|uniref:SprT-like domain-containing protein n=1 Tax=Mollisia scopiformis TaxID=149040 RepID=A0A132BA26_MOLSC|nr:uncharacterized protein LY89DRAFT_327299 [Mollisia scopiformis]KUJ08849.1 hypothetical protein LY89DRAFT_327299 [Mollisia scopiformis]
MRSSAISITHTMVGKPQQLPRPRAMSACHLSSEDLPKSSKERYTNWFRTKPLSLTHEQAIELINDANLAPEKLRILTYRFTWRLQALECGTMSNQVLLEQFLPIFDMIFFFDLLQPELCQLRFIAKGAPKWIANFEKKSGRMNAYTNRCERKESSIISRITFFEKDLADDKTQTLAHLGTLAHEMLHSFFHIYVCRCEEKCKAHLKEKNGLTGHGLPWHRCALTIETALQKALDPSIHLSRTLVMAKELNQRNESTSTMPLGELGLVVSEVEHRIAQYKSMVKTKVKEVKGDGPESDDSEGTASDGTVC